MENKPKVIDLNKQEYGLLEFIKGGINEKVTFIKKDTMKGKLIKTEFGYRLDDINSLLIASTLAGCKTKLSLKNCEAIANGYDLDELFESVPSSLTNIEKQKPILRAGFIVGFETALELNRDKKYSEEDMINFSEFVSRTYPNQYKLLRGINSKGLYTTKEIFKKYLSLQQTEFDVYFNPNEKDSNGCLILSRNPIDEKINNTDNKEVK